jgi:hypothetical protein
MIVRVRGGEESGEKSILTASDTRLYWLKWFCGVTLGMWTCLWLAGNINLSREMLLLLLSCAMSTMLRR